MVDLDLERVRHLLPESMLDIVEAIGVKSACELVKAIGGARFKFGRGKQDTPRLHILFAAIGEAKTYQLLRVFGGEELYVPRCEEALRELRNEQFRRDFIALTTNGVSKLMAMSQLCPEYKISERTGYTIVRDNCEPVSKQETLF